MARRRGPSGCPSPLIPQARAAASTLTHARAVCRPSQAFIYKTLPPKHKDDSSAEGGFASVVHRLGTAQAADTYLWSDPAHPQHSALVPRVTDDGRHVVLDVFGSTDPVTRLLAADAPGLADRKDVGFRDVNEDWDGSYYCA